MNVSNAAAIINIDMSDFGHLARAQVCALPIRQKRIDIYCENTRGCTDDRGSGGGGYLRQVHKHHSTNDASVGNSVLLAADDRVAAGEMRPKSASNMPAALLTRMRRLR